MGQVTLTGIMRSMAGIGSETTGWALQVESASDEATHLVDAYVDIEPAADRTAGTLLFRPFEDRRVTATGILARKRWDRRGSQALVRVIVIDEAR